MIDPAIQVLPATGRILVCTTVVMDIIGHYDGSFSEYERRHGLEGLNVGLQLDDLQFSYGGCGMNIAWGLSQLGIDVVPLGVAGRDFRDGYEAHLHRHGVSTRGIVVDEDFARCPVAIVLADNAGNHLTAFHSGSARSARRAGARRLDDVTDFGFAVLTPDDEPNMLENARELRDLGIPLVLDPGPDVRRFALASLRELLDCASLLVLSRHEWKALQARMGGRDAVLQYLPLIVVTAGADGAWLIGREGVMQVPTRAADKPLDPTGCGDAFRAGLLAGLARRLDLPAAVRQGHALAAINLEHRATQSWRIERSGFERRVAELGEC